MTASKSTGKSAAKTVKKSTKSAASTPRPNARPGRSEAVLEVSEEEEDDDNDDNDNDDDSASADESDASMIGPGTPSFRRPLIDGSKIPDHSSLPLLSECEYEPRVLRPMRRESYRPGDMVAWVPQAFAKFLKEHGAMVRDQLAKRGAELGSEEDDGEDVGDCDGMCDAMRDGENGKGESKSGMEGGISMPSTTSRPMRKPMDGTANSASVERVERTDVPGLSLLYLKSHGALRQPPTARGVPNGELSGVESGIESGIDYESDAAATSAAFVLPVISRMHCNVDQHVLPLSTYQEAIERCARSPHIAVPFAASEAGKEEVLWEGRVFDKSRRHDPERYPHSQYKSLHCVWYRALKRDAKGKNRRGDYWVFDAEQTDNHQSPWDTVSSSTHSTWRSAYPHLAKYVNPRAKRGVVKPSALVDAPESMELDFEGVAGLNDVDQASRPVSNPFPIPS